MKIQAILLGACALTFSLGSALAAPAGVMWDHDVLVDANGMTLYTFDKDTKDVSNCYDGCAAKWPPLFAETGDKAEGDYGIIDRKDGTQQITFKGEPLYFWVNDQAPGDKTGDGVGGVWHVIAK